MEQKQAKRLSMALGDQEDRYLQDESKYMGNASSISFPETEAEIQAVIAACYQNGESVTVQGALTGITGAGVPESGHIMNMTKMNRIVTIQTEEEPTAIVEAGVTVEQLEQAVAKASHNALCFPILPTEKSATFGGMAASGANGLQSYQYGDLMNYIKAIRVCTSQGVFHNLSHGTAEFAQWIRSEGMLGIITQMTLRLVFKPARIWGLLFFFEQDEEACQFADAMDGCQGLASLEYLDRNTIDCIGTYQLTMNTIKDLPPIPEGIQALIYAEITGNSEEEITSCAEHMLKACESAGGDPEQAWAMDGDKEIEILRAYRHAASECANMTVSAYHSRDKQVKKLSADICWNQKSRLEILRYYKAQLHQKKLAYCLFGHLGNKQPYVNILPQNGEEYKRGRELMKKWEKDAYEEGGLAFKEHGVGKLKKEEFCEVAPLEQINHYLKNKAKWDREGLFNPGNMFTNSMW